MTIALSANTPRISYTVSQGVTQTSFAVPFVFFTASTDLNVFVDNVDYLTNKRLNYHEIYIHLIDLLPTFPFYSRVEF